jgi:TonB-linked SusC/RagA family outer membrane protein
MLSYLGRVIYDYDDKILFTGSIRRDGVSRFGPENRWGNFPSASLAYKLNEDLLRNVEQINMLKLRVGWGATGNSDIGNFQYDNFLSAKLNFHPVFGVPNQVASAIYIFGDFANPLIKWESAEMFNLGIDLNAFGNRLQASAEYYVKNQNDLLVLKEVSFAFGRDRTDSAPYANIGQNRNSGVELQLSWRDFDGTFKYASTLSFTSVKNEVISIPAPIIGNNNITQEGNTIGSLYGYVAERLITPDDFDEEGNYLFAEPTTGIPSPGDIKFKDLNNDGSITDLDRTIIGKPLPDYIVGFNFEASWRNFDFSLFLNSMFNYDVFNQQRVNLEAFIGQDLDHNKDADFAKNYYTVDRPTDEYIRADQGNANDNSRISTWWVEDASFLRVRDLQLGYNLPSNLISTLGLSSTRFYVSAENPYIFTKYKGRDPENAAFSSPLTSGTDGGGFPNPRIITFGVQVEF